MYIVSKLGHDLVMDVRGSGTAPGTAVISYPKNNPTSDNQLWKKQAQPDGRFFLVSKLGDSIKLQIQVFTLYPSCAERYCSVRYSSYCIATEY